MSEKPSAVKGIHKLECIGKKGKLTKIIKVTIEQFEFLRQSLNELSLKILAYIIKGFFLNIKKSYENFSKDLETFIEININGMKPKKIKRESHTEDKSKDAENFFSIHNLSLFSENTQLEQFLADSNMTDKINLTLKKINKKFSNVDFSSMTDDKKKEYLKKNFVQPLTESLPLSYDYFMNSNIEQCISINENFANYINFDLKSITQDYLIKKNSQSQTQLSTNFEMNHEYNFTQRELDFQLVNLKPNALIRNSLFKVDSLIEFNIEKYKEQIDKVYSRDINFKDQHLIYQKNYKKILLHDHLQKFKTTIKNNESHCDISNRLNANLLIINFADLSFENCFEGLYFNKIQKEKFRNESLFTPSKDSKMSKVMSDLMTSTSIKNVFDDSLYVDTSQQIKNSQNLQNSQLNKDEKPLYNIVCENGSVNDNNYCASESYIGKEQHQLINKELQENMKDILLSKANFEEFKLDQILKEILKKFSHFPTTRNRALSTRAECSLIFYNMLIVSQSENFYLKQNAPNGKMYMIKI